LHGFETTGDVLHVNIELKKSFVDISLIDDKSMMILILVDTLILF
jgi:hypothetical protein